MWNLIRAEFLRFRRGALAFAIVHFGLLAYIDRVLNPFDQPPMVYTVYLTGLIIVAAGFGAYQLSVYAAPAAWIQLIHRPMSSRRIGLSLLLAGLLLSLIALALPVVLLLPFHGMTSEQSVETRFYLMPLAVWAISSLAYCLGASLRLGSPRLSWAGLLLLVWIYNAAATGPVAVAIQFMAFGVAFWLALREFRPDRDAPHPIIGEIFRLAMGAVGIAVTGITIVRLVIPIGLLFMGTNPMENVPPRGGFVEAAEMTGEELLIDGLNFADSREAQFWAEQAALSEVVTFRARITEHPQRYALSGAGGGGIEDRESQIVWSFSHDNMRFSANNRRDVSQAAGRPPSNVMRSPPITSASGDVIVTRNQITSYNSERQQFSSRLTVPDSETIASVPTRVWDRIVLLTDHSLRLYDANVMRSSDEAYPALFAMDVPGPNGMLHRIDMLELLDGYLVSYTYGQLTGDGRGEYSQEIWLLDNDAPRQIVARPLGRDWPELMRYTRVWFAPLLNDFAERSTQLFANANPLADTGDDRPIPQTVIWLTAFLHLLAGAGAWFWGRKALLNQRPRLLWTLGSIVGGLPVLIVMMIARLGRRS